MLKNARAMIVMGVLCFISLMLEKTVICANEQRDAFYEFIDMLTQERNRSSREIFTEVLQQMDNKLLSKAIQSNDTQLLAALIERGVINESGNNIDFLLLFASGSSNFVILKQLIDVGANINVRNYNLDTPLLMAAKAGCVDVVRSLVWHGAHVRDVISPEWLKIDINRYFDDLTIASMQGAEELECLRTQKIRLILEQDLCFPKCISRLIAQMSGTQWYTCDELDIRYVCK